MQPRLLVREEHMGDRIGILTGMYTAFNDRDIDAVLARMDRDVDWPNGMEGGRVHGHEAVRDYWTRQWTTIDPRVDPLRVLAEADERMRVEVHQVVRDLTGAVLADLIVQHVYQFRGPLIVRMDIEEAAS
jgi:limonene-1,2-epoxide hydrolase